MFITIDKYGNLTGVSQYKFVETAIEIESDFSDIENINLYFFKDLNILKKPECDNSLHFVKRVFDGVEWIEEATLEEQINYYKNMIINKTREHKLLKVSGFTGTQEEINLQVEIENLKQIYMDKNHELALQIENRLRNKNGI